MVPQIAPDDATGRIRLSEVGVVFYLNELWDHTDESNGMVKYVCSHSIIGRVRLKRVLNPLCIANRSTYLRVEVEDLVDSDGAANCTEKEVQVVNMVAELCSIQRKVGVGVHFSDQVVADMNATRGPGFWGMVSLWQDYLTKQAQAHQLKFEREIHDRIVAYLKDAKREMLSQTTRDGQEILGAMPLDVQKEVIKLQLLFQEEVSPIMREQSACIQELVQSDSHEERLYLFQQLVHAERNRLTAKLALKSILGD